MKKIQFYFIAAAFVCDCVLFVASFITVFAGFSCLFNAEGIDLGAMSAFCALFAISGYIIAPVVRDCYDDAYDN